ncbi:hypothetical protein JTE90_011882 [Oedothorax gibbosus]|uniref:Tudor domain-containing protein n=1 Tax=Oedothorax gibbosus TaxID=931172 RepID=A0AAV6V5I5_9ARAC|nr:hypothetical protein JTE90_011882 [Oedothorax gibbosus]
MASGNEYELDFRNSDWDDTKMIEAYEKSIKAREKTMGKSKKQGKNQSGKGKATIEDKLCVGMFCRAQYSGDGQFYEAKVRKVGKDTCTVEFLGYGDQEEVDPMSLKESLGKKARKSQMKVSKDENSNMSLTCESSEAGSVSHESCSYKKKLHESQVTNHMPYDYSTAEVGNTCHLQHQAAQCYAPPQIPQNMPFLAPPVPPMPQCSSIANNSSLSNLLISWYMAGYYTGLHQNQKGSSCSQRCCSHSNQCCHH